MIFVPQTQFYQNLKLELMFCWGEKSLSQFFGIIDNIINFEKNTQNFTLPIEIRDEDKKRLFERANYI